MSAPRNAAVLETGKRDTTSGMNELTKHHTQGEDQTSVTRSSASAAGWALSAYQRDRDTVFRGSKLESIAPTLDVRISDLIAPLPAKPDGHKQRPSMQISPTESDPFSDYLSYESDSGQIGEGETGDQLKTSELSKKVARETSRPQLQCTTTFASTSGTQDKELRTVTIHSPLEKLCRDLRTPAAADLPLSPSPSSLKPLPMVSHQNLESEGEKIDDAPIALASGRGFAPSRSSKPVPTPLMGVTPNFSLPAAGRRITIQPETQERSEESDILQMIRRGYQRSSPVISCLMTIFAAVCLIVCCHEGQTGATILATFPAQAFEGLANNTEYVEMYPGRVCLHRQGTLDAR